MAKQQCASNPDLLCTCWTSWVCNNVSHEEWETNWPYYKWLDLVTLKKLKEAVELELENTNDWSPNELSYLKQLIAEKNDN